MAAKRPAKKAPKHKKADKPSAADKARQKALAARRKRDAARRAEAKALAAFEAARLAEHEAAERARGDQKKQVRRDRDRARRAEKKGLREFEAARLAEHEAAERARYEAWQAAQAAQAEREAEAARLKAEKAEARKAAKREKDKARRKAQKLSTEEQDQVSEIAEIFDLQGGEWKGREGLIERRVGTGESVKEALVDLEIGVQNLTAFPKLWVQVGLFLTNVAAVDSWGRSASERYDRFKGADKGAGQLGSFIVWTAVFKIAFIAMAFNSADEIGTRAAISENHDHKITGCAFRAHYGNEPKHWTPMGKKTLAAVMARRKRARSW